MKAAVYSQFGGPIQIEHVADPQISTGGVVIQVEATGICRSDWYGWQGNDADITLPHVPGHELAGQIVEVGHSITKWSIGDRVTVPFVGGCHKCPTCLEGNQQVCDNQFQPGFTAWGSFAEYVAIEYAENNLVMIPEEVSFQEAASLGCRYITAFRGLHDVAKLKEGEWIAVYGCGGVGLAAIQIAADIGARVIAVDIDDNKLSLAKQLGALQTIRGDKVAAHRAIMDLTEGGAHVTLDALGNQQIIHSALDALRKRGRHVQIGLLEKGDTEVALKMDLIIARELQIMGSHGMQAHRYPLLWERILQGRLKPGLLISDRLSLEEGVDVLMKMDEQPPAGVGVITF